ncbi:hypothetical protein ACQ5SO_13330 [Rhodovulum sp. DZ06]|uniref:hypothetical protein n=1 Tax=Rhodovulum sp. DZ06 TaxID=3425126 RepID=UPI003D34BBC4
MNAEEFVRFAAAKTLIYRDASGEVIGAEQHLGGDRVIWSSPTGICVDGRLAARADRTCFQYADAPGEEICWSMRRDEDTVLARLETGPEKLTLTIETSDRPLFCGGKDYGA